MSQTVIAPSKIGEYFLRGTIGEGAFSIVKLAYHGITKKYFACKIVPKSRLQHGNLERRFEIEIRVNQQLHHPGIVQLVDILRDDFNYYVFMEFCPNGELFQYIVDRGRLSESEAKPFIAQLLTSLIYIHSMGVTHRDLKPENILLDHLGQLKISDFGLSRFCDSNFLATTPCGSPCYASPECISGRPYDGRTSDAWSLGVVVYAMLTGQLPWTKRNQNELFAQIKKGDYSVPTYLSPEGQSFIKSLLTVNNTERMTLEDSFRHPFMEGSVRPVVVGTTYQLISLKTVDYFFGINSDFNDYGLSENQINALYKSKSNKNLSFDSVIKEITNNPKITEDLKIRTNTIDQRSGSKLIIATASNKHVAPPPDPREAGKKTIPASGTTKLPILKLNEKPTIGKKSGKLTALTSRSRTTRAAVKKVIN